MPIYNFSLPEDTRGTNPNNKIVDELHTLTAGANRAVAPEFGAFFTNSMQIVDTANNQPVLKGTQWKPVELAEQASYDYGAEIHYALVITDPNVSNNIRIVQYQALGGPYAFSSQKIADLWAALENRNSVINFTDLVNLPPTFTPTPHRHDLRNIYGFQYLINAMERIRSAVLLSNEPVIQNVIDYVDQEISRLSNDIRNATVPDASPTVFGKARYATTAELQSSATTANLILSSTQAYNNYAKLFAGNSWRGQQQIFYSTLAGKTSNYLALWTEVDTPTLHWHLDANTSTIEELARIGRVDKGAKTFNLDAYAAGWSFNFNRTPKVLGQNIFHGGNMGPGSGLDADKLDTLHGNEYMRRHSQGSFSGNNAATFPLLNETNTYGPFMTFVYGDAEAGLQTTGPFMSWGGMSGNPASYGAQFHAAYYNAQPGRFFMRTRDNDQPGAPWGAWSQILTAHTYNAYAPTLAGGGASGTWGINVTGWSNALRVGSVSYPGDNNPSANTTVLRDASGYSTLFYTQYVSPRSESLTIDQVLVTNPTDNYMRRVSLGAFGSQMFNGNAYTVNRNNGASVTFLSRGTMDGGDYAPALVLGQVSSGDDTYIGFNAPSVTWRVGTKASDNSFRFGPSGTITHFQMSSSGTFGATNVVWLSDIRLKKDIKALPSNKALDAALKVELVHYHLKEGDESTQFGVIADQVEEIGLQGVVETNSDGYKTVRYANLALLGIGGVQALDTKVKDLTKLVIALGITNALAIAALAVKLFG